MTAKEQFKTKLTHLHPPSLETGPHPLQTASAALWTEAAIHFFLAAVLSGVVLLEECAPFGVALVAASGSGLCGGAALLGACFGALSMLGFAQGLRHISAAILTFAAAFAFYDVKLLHRPWAAPLLAGGINGFAWAVVLSQSGWTPTALVHFVLEFLLLVLSAWCYRTVLAPVRAKREDRLLTPARRTALLVLLTTLLLSLVPLTLHRDLSVGRCLAAFAVLSAAWQGGTAAGAVAGVALGAAMDLSADGILLYTLAYALAGLAAGLCRGKRRMTAAFTYTLTNAAAVLWTWDRGLPISILYEAPLAALLFLLVPERVMRRLGVWLAPELSGPSDLQAQKLVQQKLEATAQAFRTLSESIRAAFRPPRNDNDVATVFDRAAGRVCRGCALRDRCWKQDYAATFNALNDATPAMVDRGRAEAGDFPRHFSSRCLHLPAFLTAVNEELTALFYRRQYNARVQESRAAVCRQYVQLSDLLSTAAAEVSRELTPDPVGDRRLRQKAAELGLEVRTAVFRDGRSLLRVEAEGAGCAALGRPGRVAELSQLLGVPLRVERSGPDSLSLLQQEPLMAVAGVAAQKKSGETVSGDAGSYFKRADGSLYVLLCDGMGSGSEANRESSLAVRLLEQFLQAGIQARQALATLASALALRGEESGGFTTVDLLQVDLFTGEGELFKLGAAPTYLKKGERVHRLTGSSLPAGLNTGDTAAFDHFPLRLAPGDTVLMVSDGVCGTGDDSWIREKLAQFDGVSPKDLARELITQSPQEATDDRTALVVRIESRP
jgi:stage II sporulation protein E